MPSAATPDTYTLSLHDALPILRPQLRIERTGRLHLLVDGDADLPPLVDQPSADDRIRLVNRAVGQRELQVGDAGFLEQPLGFFARLVDVPPVARDLFELRIGRRPRLTQEGNGDSRLHDGNLGQM